MWGIKHDDSTRGAQISDPPHGAWRHVLAAVTLGGWVTLERYHITVGTEPSLHGVAIGREILFLKILLRSPASWECVGSS